MIMWKNIIKKKGSGKKLNFKFLKQIVLEKGKEMKGKVLNKDEYVQFQEAVRQVYTTQHKGIPLDRISQTITKILKANGLLETTQKGVSEFDADGKELGRREKRTYHFI